VVPVFFTNTSATTALHSVNPTLHINNDPSSVRNELINRNDAHLTTLSQEHVAAFDPSHPHSPLLQFLHEQFTEHLEQQLQSLRLYTTHQQLLIHQFVGNTPPPYSNTIHTNPPNPNTPPPTTTHPTPTSTPNPTTPSTPTHSTPTPTPTTSPTRRRRYLCYAVRKGRTRGIFYSWDECRLEVEGVANELKGFYTVHNALSYLDPPHSSSGPE
jgi:hypothetical protein